MNDDQHYWAKSSELQSVEAEIARIKQRYEKEWLRYQGLEQIKAKLLELLYEHTDSDVSTLAPEWWCRMKSSNWRPTSQEIFNIDSELPEISNAIRMTVDLREVQDRFAECKKELPVADQRT